jgi:hypothetical protein
MILRKNESIPVAAMCLMEPELTCSGLSTDTKVHKLLMWVKKAGKTIIS